jgi:hypothetical protein
MISETVNQGETVNQSLNNAAPKPAPRDNGTLFIAAYHFVVAAFCLLGTMVLAFLTFVLGVVGLTEDAGAFIGMFAIGAVFLVAMASCILYLAVGYGLWTGRQWGRIAAIALAVVSLFVVPIGTIAGGLTLWHLLKPEVAGRFQ